MLQPLHNDCNFNFHESYLKLGIYRHYKGNYYEVLGFAHHSETLEDLVVYRALKSPEQWWVRPASMFFENIRDEQGIITSRFTYCEESSNKS